MAAGRLRVVSSMRRLTVGDVVALVDRGNYARLSKINWYIRYGTPHTSIRVDGKQKHIAMAHYVLDVPPDMRIVYKDGNKLNLQRANLDAIPAAIHRRASRPARAKRQSKYGHISSRYKGVTHYDREWWVSRISINGKNKSLGYFYDEVTAARAYDRAALENFGEHAYRNFPELPPLTGFIGRKRPYVVGSEPVKRGKGRRPPPDEDSDFDNTYDDSPFMG